MDFRVLVAVFVTLFGIAVGMAGGDLEEQRVMRLAEQLQGAGDMSKLLDYRMDMAKPANTSISAEFTSTGENTITIKRAVDMELVLQSGAAMMVGDAQITPSKDTTVTFQAFSGDATFEDGEVTVQGTSGGVRTNNLAFNYSQPKIVKLEDAAYKRVAFTGIASDTIELKQINGTVQAGDTTIQESNQVVLEYFDGDITVKGEEFTVDGKVFQAVMGTGNPPVIIGGQ